MRAPSIVLFAAVLGPSLAQAAPIDRCTRDADCVFAFPYPCACDPCGVAERRASTRKRYAQLEQSWAVKVPRCEPCERCKEPTTWTGAEAVCRKGRCTVTPGKPRPLRRLGGVGINRVLYTLEVVYRDGAFWPVLMPRMPHHHAARFQWQGSPLSHAQREPGRRYRFDFVITSRKIRKVEGRRQWRATYHARVEKVRPAQ